MAGAVWASVYFLLGGDHFSVSSSSLGALLVLTGFLSGLAIGLGQWLVMRSLAAVSVIWITASAIGWSVGAGVGFTLTSIVDFGMLTYLIWMVVTGIIVGLVTGITIDLSLRHVTSSVQRRTIDM